MPALVLVAVRLVAAALASPATQRAAAQPGRRAWALQSCRQKTQ